jgi:cytoskeleton protein RodZ
VVLAIPVLADSAADLDVTAAEPSALVLIVDKTPAMPTTEEAVLEATPVVVVTQSALEAEATGTDVGIARSASPSNAFEFRQLADASTAPIAVEETATLPAAAYEGSIPQTVEASSPAAPAVVVNSPDGSAEVAAWSGQNTPPPLATTGGSATAAPSAGGYVPRVFGAGNEDARIVLVAESESWVQVRATSGELLLTRVLRPGDRYLVPDRPGLVMVTGNLGALRVIIDGEAAPGLGPLGVIGRDIPLDADRLLIGQVSADFDAE